MKDINYIKAILNILKAINKMNPIQEITNEYITAINFNMRVILDAIDLVPPPQMIRAPSHEEDFPLIPDGSFPDFQNTPSEFVMPEPCDQCYSFCCDGMCSEEKDEILIPRQISFEEEMDLPPPPALTRMYTNAHLPADEPEDKEQDQYK